MLDVIDISGCVVTRALTQGDKFVVSTTAYDDAALEKNHVLRDSDILDKHKLSMHGNEDTRAIISCPSVEQWYDFKRKHPDTYSLISTRGTSSENDKDRMRGVFQLRILHPAWVVFERL